jgi:hypothetical protein
MTTRRAQAGCDDVQPSRPVLVPPIDLGQTTTGDSRTLYRWMVATRTSLPFVGGGSTEPLGPYSDTSRYGHASTGAPSVPINHEDLFDRGLSTTPSVAGRRPASMVHTSAT